MLVHYTTGREENDRAVSRTTLRRWRMQPCWGTGFRCQVEGAAPGRRGELMRAEPGGYGKLVSQPWRMGELVRDQPGGWGDLKELTLEDGRGL